MSELELTPRDGELESWQCMVSNTGHGPTHHGPVSSEPGHGVNCPADHDYHGDKITIEHKNHHTKTII